MSDKPTPESLIELLYRALPFIEDAELDSGYKPGFAKSLSNAIRAALSAAERKTT